MSRKENPAKYVGYSLPIFLIPEIGLKTIPCPNVIFEPPTKKKEAGMKHVAGMLTTSFPISILN